MWIYIIIILLLLTCIVPLLHRSRLNRDIRKITNTAREMRGGNYNLRYRLQTAGKDLQELSGELNRLSDVFQTVLERTKFLEEERARMISNISHDLRTPLTSLLGYIDALQKDDTLTNEEKQSFLRIAGEKGNNLLTLIQEFFELASMEEDHKELSLQKIDLAELARTTLLGFYPDFTRLSITPSASIPEVPVYIMANTDSLRRVLNNLISNALRYGLDGKEIGIDVHIKDDTAVVEVWDKGRGILPKDLPHIFERLYTTEVSRNSELRGTGLGLTIAKNLIEKQGGEISVRSIPGERTVFTVRLPISM